MGNWLQKVTFLPLKFHLVAKEDFILPTYKGSTFRGGFGYVFKKSVCATKFTRDCKECLLRSSCVYAYIFESVRPKDAEIMRKYEHVPHPFVLFPPLTRNRQIKEGDKLVVEIVLIGKAIDYLAYFVLVMEKLGQNGLGIEKGKCELTQVIISLFNFSNEKIIYSAEDKELTLNIQPFTVSDLLQDFVLEHNEISLRFLTPLNLIRNGEKVMADLTFKDIIRSLLRRIRLLAYFHCGLSPQELELDFTYFMQEAEKVREINKKLRWFSVNRYSTRQKQRMPVSGIVGKISFQGNLKPFWEFLLLGQYLNIGKNTSFGCGRYRVELSQGQ
ncbi:MAG: CRISPR system precrRNA processing endoribonuclease RAMP protein Cas6 [Desulfonauticus sp.]|nr:CRISPR system precrRNA processing endoribonuclease RAMP protein Cas6 [Desulfonauticus sp.]